MRPRPRPVLRWAEVATVIACVSALLGFTSSIAIGSGFASRARHDANPEFRSSGTTAPASRPAPRFASITGTWSRIPPPHLEESAVIYDPVRQRLLVFGGEEGNSVSNDLWELSLSGTPAWTLLATSGARPPARASHGVLYDPVRDRLLLFGGRDSASNTLNDLWSLPLATLPLTWSQSVPVGPQPAPRAYTTAVYDSAGDRVVLFGGALAVSDSGPPSNFVNDVWALPLNVPPVWIQLSPSGTPPSARAAAMVIKDPLRGRMVVHGGFDGGVLNDTWALSLDILPQWWQVATTGGPPDPRAVGAAVYDPPNDRMLLYGGIGGPNADQTLADVWSLDLDAWTWSAMSPGGTPPVPLNFPAPAYDLQRRRMVVYAARDSGDRMLGDVAWALGLDQTDWVPLTRGPSSRLQSAGAFDPLRNRLIVYGGNDEINTVADVWALSLSGTPAWTEITGSNPGQRIGHSVLYDPVRDRMLVFGGKLGLSDFNDVWALSLAGTPAWSQLNPSGGPPPARSLHSAIYDSQRDRMIVFGGRESGGLTFVDTWALDLATETWSLISAGSLAPEGGPQGPGPRAEHVAVYDDLNDRMLVFSGMGQASDVWALSLSGTPGWTQLSTFGTSPNPRHGAVAVYDLAADAMLLFGGGNNSGGQFNDTWILQVRGTPTWSPIDVGSSPARGRRYSAWGYDQSNASLVVFGGEDGRVLSDAWKLSFDRTTPVLATLSSAVAGPRGIELTAWLSEPVGGVRVERREPASEWQTIATVDVDAAGRLEYVDESAEVGKRYGYRLAVPDGESFRLTGEAWVDVPSAPRFALEGFVPNPARADAGVDFTLPKAGPARLEVLDVTGRRVLSREVGGLGPGRHVLKVEGSALAPGLYVIRLRAAGGLETVRRGVVLD